MLESDLRDLFERQAASEAPPPVPISIPAVRRIGRARLRRRRVGTFASPVLAAGAVVGVVLAGQFASGPAGRVQPSTGKPAASTSVAPTHFNPLVPYAAAGWYPYRVTNLLGYAWPTALRLIGLGFLGGNGPGEWTSIVVYAGDECVLTTSHLSCGSTATGTGALLTVSGRAPDVGRHVAYWIRQATGDLTPDIPAGEMVAFQYARHGWAMVTSASTPADVIRIAANLRYGQTSPIRFPVRLTGLPPSWREVQQVQFIDNGTQFTTMALGRHPSPRTSEPPDSLFLRVGIGRALLPPCNRRLSCQTTVINGYKVYLTTLVQPHGQPADHSLNAPNAAGLNLEIDVIGPRAPLSPAAIFARYLKLLGPDPANWTTQPVG